MKKIIVFTIYLGIVLGQSKTQAQTELKSKVALFGIDNKALPTTSDFATSSNSITAITRLELEKLNVYSLIDPYDLEYLEKRDKLNFTDCYSTYCIAELAGKLNCEKVFTGSITLVAERLVIQFKVYDTKLKGYDKQIVKEFLNLPQSLPSMIRITLNDMFMKPNNQEEVNTLTKNFLFDEARNNPYTNRLRADGPRMGLTYFTGDAATLLAKPRKDGGYNAMPLMFQFGYQFERQYLNQGNFQALFEVVPMITGLDQGLFIPSLTIMNGIRNNKNGWEFAFGPSISITKKSSGFYNDQNEWKLASDTVGMLKKPYLESRIDSRGEWSLHPSFIFAVGKTFKSGKLNIPVNAYFVPSSEGYRIGISFGFNSRDRYENTGIKN